MQYTTLGQVLQWVATPYGKVLPKDRDELVNLVNRIRQHFYLLYERHSMFMDLMACIQIQKFCEDCHKCREFYYGVTLPYTMQTPEAMWVNDTPIRMYDRWREWVDRRISSNNCYLEKYDMGHTFPTERDICPCGCATHLKILAISNEDIGKKVTLRFVDEVDEEREETILLDNEYKSTEFKAKQILTPGGVVLPPNLCGKVILAQDDDRILSEYNSSEHVPSYRRLKITGVCEDDQVYIRANREYYPLCDDTELIETANMLAFSEMAYYFRYAENTGEGGGYQQKAEIHKARAEQYLLGETSRENGKADVKRFDSFVHVEGSGLNENSYYRYLW